MQYFVREKDTFKDGTWGKKGFVAYLHDYNTRPLPDLYRYCAEHDVVELRRAGALYFTAEGDTPEKATERLRVIYQDQ